MVIECPYCEAKVDGKVLAEHGAYSSEDPSPFNAILLECPVCKNSLLGGYYDEEMTQHELDNGPNSVFIVYRLWPEPDGHVSFHIPRIVGNSLGEAKTCFKAKAYSACAVMCGRVLEGVCQHFSTKSKNLATGLVELKKKGIIDERLLLWGQEMRKHRNIGAHATEEKIPKEDAKDLLDFAQAICDYVFVLNAKFDRFMKRKDKQ